ncbi:MAG: hypothetical protein IKS10_09350 [Lachnospiraceae bacterium]|nr:hypothetical protein [Lachnospiraceae bacterium]
MTIAILDDGVHDGTIITETYHIDLTEGNEPIPFSSHGTVCAKIIEKYGDVDRFIDIRILEPDRRGCIEGLIKALDRCLKMDIDVINISCGIELFMMDDPKVRKLHRMVLRLKRKGTLIFAAQSNVGRLTVPAAFPEVISVEHAAYFRNRIHSIYRISDVYIRAPRVVRLNKAFIVSYLQNSYSCAMACAKASKSVSFVQKTKMKRHYFPLLRDKIMVPVVFIRREKASGEWAVLIKRALQEEGCFTDIICDMAGDKVPGARFVGNDRSRYWLARYIRESFANVLLLVSARGPDLGKDMVEMYTDKDNRIHVLCNKTTREYSNTSRVCKIVEEVLNTYDQREVG